MSVSARTASDRNLLFGILALQMDFISREALIKAMQAWVLEKSKPLGQVLIEQGAMAAEHRALLEPLVQKHVEMHGNDPQKSLAAISSAGSAKQELAQIADADLQAGLATVSVARLAEEDPWATRPPSIGTPTSSGLRFRVLRPHAKGGLGQVSVALDEELHREVAFKEIQDRHADYPDSRARFLLEAEITGGLEHPGIVPVYGLGAYPDGRPFYAMRFIKGDSLQDAIARFHKTDGTGSPSHDRALALRQLLGRFIDVCDAIAYAHSRGVLHRDLKPGNVMLGPYGETLVVDWGLAKTIGAQGELNGKEAVTDQVLRPVLSDSATPTQAGSAIGTPAYMPPEQAAGRLDKLGPASDVYSLGATLYCLLTGKAPFEGNDVGAILRQVQGGYFARPREVRRDVPAALEAVCLKAMAPKPEDRYASPRALAADVERWLADEPVSAYREPWAVRSRRWMRRHRTLVSTAVGVLAIALVSAIIGLVLVSDAQRNEATARKTAEDKEKEARFNQYVAEMHLVQRVYEANNLGRVRELLDSWVPREPNATDFRGFEWYYWQRMAHRELLTLEEVTDGIADISLSSDGRRLATANESSMVRVRDTYTGKDLSTLRGHKGLVRGLSFCPDGRQLATVSDDGTVRIWDTDTGKELLALIGLWVREVRGLSFSPDGRRLALALFSVIKDSVSTSVCVFDTATGEKKLTLSEFSKSISFSPDSRRLVSAGKGGEVRVWDAATGKELLTLKVQSTEVNCVSFSPDGQQIASAGWDGTVHVWAAATGKEILTFRAHQDWVNAVAFSRDGRRLASASRDSSVRVWDTATGKELFTLKGHTNSVLSISFSADGRRLISAGEDRTVRVWDAATGSEMLTFEDGTFSTGVSFGPDGKRLASARGNDAVSVWDTATGKELLTIRGAPGVTRVSFSPDGKRLASGNVDCTVSIWDAATGRKMLTLKGHASQVNGLSFSPDGKWLASSSAGMVCVWDVATGKSLRTLFCNSSRSKGISFEHLDFGGVSFSPDGQRLACGGDEALHVWNIATGEELLNIKGHGDWVNSVAFSPDGQQLASTDDQMVRIWDAFTGKELLTLKGHKGPVFDASFSPDGRRLASGGRDHMVRVWDTVTGKELLALKGGYGVSFSPDGQRLASTGNGGVHLWEAVDVPEAIWRQRGLVRDVASLYEKLLIRDEVLTVLRQDITLDEADRKFALEVAESRSEDPQALKKAAWEVVKTGNASKDASTRALRCAEAAARLMPEDGNALNTLGVAQYRIGRHEDALATLTKSEKANATWQGSHPGDLAFLAMTQYQLGKKNEAKAALGRLRVTMKQPRWAQNAECAAFLREAEALIEGKAVGKKP